MSSFMQEKGFKLSGHGGLRDSVGNANFTLFRVREHFVPDETHPINATGVARPIHAFSNVNPAVN